MATIQVWQQRLDNAHANMMQHNNSAFDALFGVLELAEVIFLQLPPQQLLVSVQRVCRKWRDIVTASTPIQQALFFRPIRNLGPLHFVESPREHRGGSWVSSQASHCPFAIHEHLLVGPLLLLERQPSRAIARPEASWRRQLLTQPPVRAVTVNVGASKIKVDGGLQGVTMGNIWDATHLCPPGSLSISNWSLWSGYSNEWRNKSASDALRVLKAAKK